MRFDFLRSFIAAAALATALPAGAITVNSTADADLATLAGNSTCELREAVMAINMSASVAQCVYDGATITFAAALAGQTITLTTDAAGWCAWSGSRLSMCKSAVIASEAGQVTLDFQGHNGFVFAPVTDASAKIIVALRGVRLTGARMGGALFARSSARINAPDAYGTDLTLDTVAVDGNATDAWGGGVHLNSSGISNPSNRGALVIRNSLFTNNTAAFHGAAVHAFSPASIYVSNTTFQGNTAGANHMGGAIAVDGAALGPLTLDHLTVTGNTAGKAGGIGIGTGFDIRLSNSIVAGNTAATGPHDMSGNGVAFNSTLTASHDIFGGLDPAVLTQVQSAGGNITSFPALAGWLAALTDNGGPTHTRALLNVANNPALNAGNDAIGGTGTDQRGTGYARTVGAHTDIGAYESQSTLAASITAPQPTSVPYGQAQGVCDLPVGAYPVGTYTLSAAYGGDAAYGPSAGTANVQILQQEVLPQIEPPASPAVLTAGVNYAFTYNDLYYAFGPGPVVTPPTGTFTVTTDEGVNCTLPIQPVAGTCTLHFDNPGTHAYFIAYTGDAGYKLYQSEQVLHVDVAPAAAAQAPVPVPALSPWAAVLLAASLALMTAWVVRTQMR